MEKERKNARDSTPSPTNRTSRVRGDSSVRIKYRERIRPKASRPAETLALLKMPVMRTPVSYPMVSKGYPALNRAMTQEKPRERSCRDDASMHKRAITASTPSSVFKRPRRCSRFTRIKTRAKIENAARVLALSRAA